MNPTRSIDGKSAPQAQRLKRSEAAQAAQREASAKPGPDDSARDRVELSAEGLDQVGRREVARLDDAKLSALRDAVRTGSYQVDAAALADRLLDDAFGD